MFYYSAAILPSILHSRGEGESYLPPKKTIISFNDSTHGLEPWRINDDNITRLNGKLLFSAYDGASTQLYLTDGTQEGTQIVNTSSTYTD